MNDLTKKLKCVVMRNGIEIWKEEERLNELSKILISGGRIGFIKIDDEIINASDVSGIFSPQTIEEMTRRKNGQWKCEYNKWHDKFKKCECKLERMTGDERARYSRGF